jgi:signal transduction histidine kinase
MFRPVYIFLFCLIVSGIHAQVYTDIRTIKQLTPKKAEQKPSVRLTGVVTHVFPWHPRYTSFTLTATNEPNGIAVFTSLGRVVTIEPGMLVEGKGVAEFRKTSPVVFFTNFTISGHMKLPQVPLRRLADLHEEMYFNQSVALTGVVRKKFLLHENQRTIMQYEVQNQDGTFVVFFQNPDLETYDWDGLVDAEVRFSGCAILLDSRRKELQNKGLYLSDTNQIVVLKPAPTDPFSLSPIPANTIFPQYNDTHRKLVRGVVTLIVPGQFLYIQNDQYGIRVNTEEAIDTEIGDEVDVSGFLTHNNILGDMTGCVIRKTGRTVPVAPVSLSMNFPVDSFPQGNERINEFNGLLIRIQGELVQISKPVDNYSTIIFRHLSKNYRAICYASNFSTKLNNLSEGQPLELTGILNVNAYETSNPQTLIFPSDWYLLLRDAQDITPLPGGPWLTPQRKAALQGGGGMVLLVLIAMIIYLRRKILNTHLIMAERKRMAADLHDTLEQSIAATAMQLKAANDSLPPVEEDTRSFINLASQILATAKADLRSSVWNLRSNSLKTKTIEESIRDLAKTVRGIDVKCDMKDFPADIPDYHGIHIFSIVQEAVTNAMKHSCATVINIVSHDYSITISDNGSGFDPEARHPGHFGIPGMSERASRFGGSVDIKSSPGKGTCITINLPHFSQEGIL